MTMMPNQTSPLPRPANDHDTVRARWTAEKRTAFKILAPASLSLVASDGPVSVTLWSGGEVKHRFGHNRGVWPAKLAKGAGWRDSATQIYDKNPFVFIGTQFRLWLRTEADRDSVAASILDLIARRAEADGGLDVLLNGFQDLGPDLDLALFEFEAHGIAQRLASQCWDDDGLSDFLDRVVRRASDIRATARRGRADPIEVAIAAEIGVRG